MPDKNLKTSAAQRRASLKWEQANAEKITIKIRKDGSYGFTKEDVKSAAERDGMSLNAWIVGLIRDNL